MGNLILKIASKCQTQDETAISFTDRFDDQYCSKLFASIAYEERMRFFKEWVRYRSEREYIAYDITSISTYSKGTDLAEWGYNRDGENLAQVNMGMFYGAESRLPVFYELYSGSIADKSRLAFMMQGASKLGIEKARFVLDRGFVTQNNLRFLSDEGIVFVTAFPKHWLETKRIIDGCRSFIRKSANRLSEYGVYSMSEESGAYGFPMKVHVFFNPEKCALDEKEFFANIERLQADLEEMSRRGNRLQRKYTNFFTIETEMTGKLCFELDNDKIDYQLGYAGFFVLMTNDPDLSSLDVLRIYRSKDTIEKNFDQLKNCLDFKRLRTHYNQTAEGKVFVGFLALILRSHLLKLIKENSATRHFVLNKVLIELRKIKLVTFDDFTSVIMPLTKTQRTILEAIGVSSEMLETSVDCIL